MEKAIKMPRVAKVGKGGRISKAVRVAKAARMPKGDRVGKMELMTLKLPASVKEKAAKVTKLTTRTTSRMEHMALKRTAKLIGNGKVRMEPMALKTVLLQMSGGGLAKEADGLARASKAKVLMIAAAVKVDGMAKEAKVKVTSWREHIAQEIERTAAKDRP